MMDGMEPYHIALIVISCLIALITIYLIALFIKSKAFKAYSCFNIMLMSIILFLDCLSLIIYETCEKKKHPVGKFILLLICTFLDKMIISVLSLQVIIIYAGIIHTDYYFSHDEYFVKIGNTVCAIISGALAVVYSSIRWIKRENGMEFDENPDDDKLQGEIKKRNLSKKILETIFCGVNFIVNVFFLVVVILHISKKRREAKAGLIEDLGYKEQLLRFSLIFSVNIILIIYSGIIANFSQEIGLLKFKDFENYSGIVFLIICFLIELCFMINKTVYQETLKIFCKKKYRETQEEERLKSVSTFPIDSGEDGDYNDDN